MAMARSPGWIEHPVNRIAVNGVLSPGIAIIGGAAIKRKWDVRNGYGIEGSTIVLTQIPLVPFDVKIQLWSVEDWRAWDEFKTLLHRVPNRFQPRALQIEHPILAELKIAAVVVESISQFIEVNPGVWEVTIGFVPYRKRKPLPLMKPEGTSDKPKDEPFITPLMQGLIDQTRDNTAQFREGLDRVLNQGGRPTLRTSGLRNLANRLAGNPGRPKIQGG